MIARKSDAQEIETFIRELAGSLSLEPLRSWWPDYLFHTTELLNAVAILESGKLLSRQDAGDLMRWENANSEIITRTPGDVREMVRFYFRPRTPMNHNNEGFRTAANRHPHAYCPFPVVLVVSSLPILTATGTQFSDGNCSSRGTRRGDTAAFLRSLPFAEIYHDSAWHSGDDGERIKQRRQAEVLVPSPLDIDAHRPHIRLRSAAERETLLTLLTSRTAARYRNQIQVSSKQRLFHKHWTYIETVSIHRNQLTIRFNESTADKNEFPIQLIFSALDGALLTEHEVRTATIEPLRLPLSGHALVDEPFRLRIEIDRDLAYSGILDPRSQQLVQMRL